MAAEHGTITTADGRKLNKVEAAKLAKDGLDIWDDIFRYAADQHPPALDETRAASFLAAGGTAEDLPAAARQAAIPEDDYIRMRWFGIYQQLPNNGHHMLRI